MKQEVLEVQKKYGSILAKAAFENGALNLSPEKPFTWASGYRMPIYNDNRRMLAFPKMRSLIAEAFEELAKCLDFNPDWVAGVATGGIPHATVVANKMNLPMCYIRSKGKDHGLGNQIEGLGSNANFQNETVLVIEDLISTGGSSIQAIEAVNAANGLTPYCFAIFSYGFEKASDAFSELRPECKPLTILNYETMLDVALVENYISQSDKRALSEWRLDPFAWGERNGFLPIK
ncbi:MAG: orotate phosphoribosyltransferase [Treponema sp.]|nr:MAG: orotate phosphoribosyltransferase [Treponema sp.]